VAGWRTVRIDSTVARTQFEHFVAFDANTGVRHTGPCGTVPNIEHPAAHQSDTTSERPVSCDAHTNTQPAVATSAIANSAVASFERPNPTSYSGGSEPDSLTSAPGAPAPLSGDRRILMCRVLARPAHPGDSGFPNRTIYNGLPCHHGNGPGH
jgi:hypothetical protein